MKANNYEQTLKQVPKEWGINVPDSISDACKDYYHVLMVRRENNPELETYHTVASVQQYPKDGWNKRKGAIKDMLPILGYKHMFILHDPTKKVEPVKKAGRPKKTEETSTED